MLSRAPVRQMTLFPLFTCKLMGFFIALREVYAVAVISTFFVFGCGHKFPDAGRGKIPKWYCPRLLTRKVNTIIETRENTRYIPISVSLALIMRAIPWKKWPAQMSDTGNNNDYYAGIYGTRNNIWIEHNEGTWGTFHIMLPKGICMRLVRCEVGVIWRNINSCT